MKAAMARHSFSIALRTFRAARPFLSSNAPTRVSTADTTSGQLWRRKTGRFGFASISLKNTKGKRSNSFSGGGVGGGG